MIDLSDAKGNGNTNRNKDVVFRHLPFLHIPAGLTCYEIRLC